MAKRSQPETILSREVAAQAAGLSYADTNGPGLGRRRAGKGFSYRAPNGRPVTDPAILRRIRALMIPPAWTSVWICPDPNGHIQAVGRDEKGRRQYVYHTRFREVREEVKFEHMMAFAAALPRLRQRVAIDMAAPGLGRDKVLATIVHLLETTMIRVGNEAYAKQNESFGLTTLLGRHVDVAGADLKFHFKGKSGKMWRLSVHDRRVARIVRASQELPGQHLFEYVDHEGRVLSVTSSDVNAYLKEVAGAEITAKDFRTWTGTVLAAVALAELEAAGSATRAKRNLTSAIERVAARLGNTPTICRKCYVHPEIISAYLDGGLLLEVRKDIDERLGGDLETLRPEEAAVLAFLSGRVARELSTASARRGNLGSEAGSPPGKRSARA